ncbi:serine hydrolase [Actinokineospora sp.]|uniref:serine hydrolase n=1 Tax=Actinokineospora sp. TaxID=1872133 RepID=UPI004038019C
MADLTGITADDPRYADLAKRGDNARFTPNPELFVRPASTEDVVEAVRAAVTANRRVAARSGGHCYEGFVSAGVDVVVDLAALDSVEWDAERAAVAVGPGARLLDLHTALYERWGVTVPCGASATVAVGGHVVGGGYGPMSRSFGLTVDHVHAVEVVVVDADGTTRAVVATREPDDPNHELWWALTGAGGGNLGVITRYWLRAADAKGDEPGEVLPQPPGTVWATSRMYPRDAMTPEAFRALVGGYGRWHERNSAPGSPHAGVFAGLVLLARQEQDDSGLTAILFVRLLDDSPGAEARLAATVAEMTSGVAAFAIDTPVANEHWLASIAELAKMQDGDGGRHKVKSAYLRQSYTDAQIDTVYERLAAGGPYESASISLQSTGCAINAVPPAATAVPQRDSVLRALYLATWRESDGDATCLDWMRELYRDVYAATGGVPVPDERNDGCHINFPDIDLADRTANTSGVPWQHLYFGDNHERLLAAAKAWDPRGVFRHALSIRQPHDWSPTPMSTTEIAPPVLDPAHPLRTKLRQAIEAMLPLGAAGAQFRVSVGEDTFVARAGVEAFGAAAPVPVDGRFRIACITKMYVSVVLLQLTAEGKVDLDAPIATYLPDLLPDGDKVTVRQMLQHTSGLYNHADSFQRPGERFQRDRYNHYDAAELVAVAAAKPLNFEPGTKFEYSNTNYIALGLLIKAVTGKSYEEEIRTRILEPLGLRNTVLPGEDPVIHGPHARGYMKIKGESVDVTEMNPSEACSAGSIIATTADLDAFLVALMDGKLLAPAQFAEMKTTVPPEWVPLPMSNGYGLGFMPLETDCGLSLWGHGGGIPGYATFVGSTLDGHRRLIASITLDIDPDDFSGAFETSVVAALNAAAECLR